jgi:hypothetical protein
MPYIIRRLDIDNSQISLGALILGYDVVIKSKGKKPRVTYYATLNEGYKAFWRYCKRIKEGKE